MDTSLQRDSDSTSGFEVIPRRLVIIGKTGNGKSSIGNIILRRHDNLFEIGTGMSSTTVTLCTGDSAERDFTVFDTPDMVNCEMSDADAKKQVEEWRTSPETSVAVIVAIRCDVRYTAEEYAIYTKIKDLWGDDFCKNLVIAFTFKDRLDHDEKEFELELKTVCQELQNVLEDARHRYVLFDCSPGRYVEELHGDIFNKLAECFSRDMQTWSFWSMASAVVTSTLNPCVSYLKSFFP
ncbi:GTPase IMAP family member 4-like [Pomacea canaliculata]|uniref:GTPase IMAP family member 4-like n=1 Tax=Pomacea canaliculata TaxID=400727 RepID=UPI000D739143|nr:GTPase IMAP family member 4-like [Pomacea canaliculata]XP_025111472.1 GTPase IMAP family member 4-like [Pomacea canaliculata]XP_025111473.1 GTPase IMAP family member 4-like [Pomacea canaliculata]